ncbi:MAG: IS5 family transposase [Chlamydiae bacterium]|nr:IS5 family transposase [Chlamydiota bacterium]
MEKAGRPFKFSDDAILTLLILKFVYHLPFRQLAGFTKSLIAILHLSIQVPHYSCINKRMKKLQIPSHLLSKRGITDIVFDTTGVRIYSAGQWKKEKYGGRRRWKKIHLGINLATKEIIFAKATNEHTHDLAHIEDVLNKGNLRRGKLLIDGIADTHDLYDLSACYQKDLLTPPRKGASPFTGSKSRQNHVNLIRALGGDDIARSIWAKLTGYNERAHVEGTFSRWKRVLGEDLSSRSDKNIDLEVHVKSLILNK